MMSLSQMGAVVFADRDGTIIREPRDKQIDSLEKLEFVPGIITGLRLLTQSGIRLVMVTNQDGLGSRRYPKRSFDIVQAKILTTLAGEGVHFDHICVCPHRPQEACACRKPQTALVSRWLKENPIRKESSFVLGDRVTDVEFAHNLGVRAVRLRPARAGRRTRARDAAFFETSSALEACEEIVRAARTVQVTRTTLETDISCRVALTGRGRASISTGIGFFDHMLAQIARHSGFDIDLKVRGDLHIDEHHTVEDVALTLGEAIRKALGNKAGIRRYGFVLPMDEARAEAALDLSGRPAFRFDVEFKRERVGEFATEMVEHFFRSFSESLGASLHLGCTGRNEHHKIEALFKSLGRALGQATELELNRLTVPSSKGVL
jgi:imidazoleglycerol-phosphate dehydratase/histidinol-phosphatase